MCAYRSSRDPARKERRDDTELRDPREMREPRDSRESRLTRDPREMREPRDFPDPRESRESRRRVVPEEPPRMRSSADRDYPMDNPMTGRMETAIDPRVEQRANTGQARQQRSGHRMESDVSERGAIYTDPRTGEIYREIERPPQPYPGDYDDYLPSSGRPMAPTDTGRMNIDSASLDEFFVPGENIDREVMQRQIPRWLGPDATCRPGKDRASGRSGYIYKAYRPLTTNMVRSLQEITLQQRAERAERDMNRHGRRSEGTIVANIGRPRVDSVLASRPMHPENTYRGNQDIDMMDDDDYDRRPYEQDPRMRSDRVGDRMRLDSRGEVRESRDPRYVQSAVTSYPGETTRYALSSGPTTGHTYQTEPRNYPIAGNTPPQRMVGTSQGEFIQPGLFSGRSGPPPVTMASAGYREPPPVTMPPSGYRDPERNPAVFPYPSRGERR